MTDKDMEAMAKSVKFQMAVIEVVLEDPSKLPMIQQKYGQHITLEKLQKRLEELKALAEKDQQQ